MITINRGFALGVRCIGLFLSYLVALCLRKLASSLRVMFDLFQLLWQSKCSFLFDYILKSATLSIDIMFSSVLSVYGLLNLIMLHCHAFMLKFMSQGSLSHAYFYLGVNSVFCLGFYGTLYIFLMHARRATLNQIFVICGLMWFEILSGKLDLGDNVGRVRFLRVLNW